MCVLEEDSCNNDSAHNGKRNLRERTKNAVLFLGTIHLSFFFASSSCLLCHRNRGKKVNQHNPSQTTNLLTSASGNSLIFFCCCWEWERSSEAIYAKRSGAWMKQFSHLLFSTPSFFLVCFLDTIVLQMISLVRLIPPVLPTSLIERLVGTKPSVVHTMH